MICPIVIATVKGHGLAVLLESIKQYAPECPVYLRGPESVIENFQADFKIYGQPRNFGEDYNEVIEAAMKDWSSCIVANDDGANHFFALFLADIAAALALASALELAPHALRLSSSRVGSPPFISGPGILPILAKKLARLGLSPALTGALRSIPCAFALARPLAFKPPVGLLPSLRCQAGVFISLASLQSWLRP